MKRYIKLGIIAILLIFNVVFIGTTIFYKTKLDKEVFRVFSFQGESSEIKISDGVILIAPDKEIVNGGNVEYIGSDKDDIKYYSEKIYLDKEDDKRTISMSAASFEGEHDNKTLYDELQINKSVGEISSQSLFIKEDINSIKDNLYFSIEYITVTGEKRNINLKLEVKEFDLSKMKE